MKQGRTLRDLAQEIERQRDAKRDFVVTTRQLTMGMKASGRAIMSLGSDKQYEINEVPHGQIAERLGIGMKYYDLMREKAPELLIQNVNHWFTKKPETRMVRTMDGNMRAFLSDRFRRLDNAQVMEAVLPALQDAGELEVASCEVTERKLYLKVLFPKFEGDIGKGDIVRFGLRATNSEIGMGSFEVSLFAMTLACLNGMTVEHGKQRRAHLGKRLEAQDDGIEFTNETLEADDKAFFLKVRDTVKGLLTEDTFRDVTKQIRATRGEAIEGDVPDVVKELGKRVGYSEGESNGILKHLIQGGDISQWGVISAVTRYAADVASYDRATELEEIGGKILALDPGEWRRLAA